MSTAVIGGPIALGLDIDEEGHRTYGVRFQVKGVPGTDGPANVAQTPGLPSEGDPYTPLSDPDVYAWYRLSKRIKAKPPITEGEAPIWWTVDMVASTRPPGNDRGRGAEPPGLKPEDPTLRLDKVSGGFTSEMVEATEDQFGVAILSSSHEQLRGPQVEFEEGDPYVRIEQQVLDLQLGLMISLNNTVNKKPMWGLPARTVRLKVEPWERKFHGRGVAYYQRVFTCLIKVRVDAITGEVTSGHDREALDEGSKALFGEWFDNGTELTWRVKNIGSGAANPDNPAHFDIYLDRAGNPGRAILDGRGKPINEVLSGAVTAATNATPIIITSAAHGLVNGDTVAVYQVGGNTAANGGWVVVKIDANRFELVGSVGNGAYTTGGSWRKRNSNAGKIPVQKYRSTDFPALLNLPPIF